VGGNGGGLGILCPKCFQAWLKKFHATFPNHLGGFF
jgi:hypothetical protein